MNGFSLAWRSVIRKPVKSVLLFVTVFTISLLLLSGMSSGKATIQMQDNTRQAIGAGILLEENEADRHRRIDELSGQLGEEFYRCHRAYIVNMDCITEYDGESITLTGGDRVYLAKKKYGEFVKAYMWHLQNGGVSSV